LTFNSRYSKTAALKAVHGQIKIVDATLKKLQDERYTLLCSGSLQMVADYKLKLMEDFREIEKAEVIHAKK